MASSVGSSQVITTISEHGIKCEPSTDHVDIQRSGNENGNSPGYADGDSEDENDAHGPESEMLDESECFYEEDWNNHDRQYLQQLSDRLMEFTEMGEVTDEIDGEGIAPDVNIPIITYLKDVKTNTRSDVAHYLSTGDLEYANLNLTNLHDFYHVASLLRLRQLRDHCERFCSKHDLELVLSSFEGCDCRLQINKISASGYKRLESVHLRHHQTDLPQYYIVFTGAERANEARDKRKVNVKVIDVFDKSDVYKCEVKKLRNFGDGFSCCSCEIKESPFVFVSGGTGKSSHAVYKYDVILGRWDKRAQLLHGRSFHMMVSFGSDSIFVVGGKEVPCIEEYSIRRNKWCERSFLVTHVTSAVCMIYQTKIYIFGGKTSAGPVSTVQCYDINARVTSQCQELPCSFEGGQAVLAKDRIFIATDQSHVICFDPEKQGSWLCSHAPVQRAHFGMFYKNDRIYVVGGVTGDGKVTTEVLPYYRYNYEKDTWAVEREHCHEFPVHASCVINYPSTCFLIPFDDQY